MSAGFIISKTNSANGSLGVFGIPASASRIVGEACTFQLLADLVAVVDLVTLAGPSHRGIHGGECSRGIGAQKSPREPMPTGASVTGESYAVACPFGLTSPDRLSPAFKVRA